MFSKNFVSFFEHNKNIEREFQNNNDNSMDLSVNSFFVNKKNILSINNFLKENEAELLLQEFNFNKKVKVGIDGILSNYKEGEYYHSLRSTMYSEKIARCLYLRVAHLIESQNSPYKDGVYKPIGINPAFRFIGYNKNGYLIPHYDFPYFKNESTHTLLSLVIYLVNDDKGRTRFIKEYRENDFSDLKEPANEKDVLFSSPCIKGNALIFPHDILHESKETPNEKVIIRTDIIFERT